MRLAAPAPEAMLPWLATRAGITITPDLRAIAAIDDNGQIAGMVGFDGWLPNACSLHVAFEDPRAIFALRRFAFGIPFIQQGRGVLLAWVLSDNAQSLRLTKGMGFKETHRVKDGWKPGVDLVLHEMRRDECRWLGRS